MFPFSRTISLSVARGGLGILLLALALFGVWTASDLGGQAAAAPPQKKPRVEEEEDTPQTPPKRKVIRVEGEETPTTRPTPLHPSAPPAGDLKQLARQARHPDVRNLFNELAVPHDHVVFKKADRVTSDQTIVQRVEEVEPIPVYLGSEPAKFRKLLTVTPLDSNWKPSKPFNPRLENIQLVQPYERIAQEKVREFLEEFSRMPEQNKNYLPRFDMLIAAEQALSAVLRWHESARATGQRNSDERWAAIEADLRQQLLNEVLLKQLEELAKLKDWDGVLALTRRLAVTYTNTTDQQRIAQPVAELLKSALNDPTGSDEKKQEARKRLHQLEEEFPDNPVFSPLGAGLREDAQHLLDEAKELAKEKSDKNLKDAMQRVRQAEEIWPQLPGLHAFKIELSAEHPVLRVGVRGRLPKYLSPARACTDAERRVVEMLFESLVKLSPDEAGIFRYRLGLAEYRPRVVPLGRQFQLPRNAAWFDPDPKHQSAGKPPRRLDASDVRFTVTLLKAGVGTGRSCAWGQLLDKVEVKGDPFWVTLRLNQGYLDPLALMTFKVLPHDQRVDSKEFALQPVTSGPFRLEGVRSDEKRREYLAFVANPFYGSRPGKRDLPRIQEVRFYVYNDALKELRHDDLDLVLDLTAQEAAQLIREKADDWHVSVPLPPAATPNRRIYFLAVNQRKVPDRFVRLALAYAINRERLLDKYFRGPLKQQVHQALNGPFPMGSWACNPALTSRQDKGSLDLFNADDAQKLSQVPAVRKAVAEGPLRLKYPKGDPALEDALKELCHQVKETTGLVLELVPRDPCQLREDVEQTQSYDLAYYHYDFPDETYWLWPLLGQSGRADADSRNYLNFTDDKIHPLLREAMAYRDFAKVREDLRMIHKLFNQEMPLIPLWQLDPLLAYRQDVKPTGLDAVLVFTNIEEWRLQRK